MNTKAVTFGIERRRHELAAVLKTWRLGEKQKGRLAPALFNLRLRRSLAPSAFAPASRAKEGQRPYRTMSAFAGKADIGARPKNVCA
jgi:hypothetical protein